MDLDLRENIYRKLGVCVDASNAAFGILFHNDSLVSFAVSSKMQVAVEGFT